MRCEFRVDFHHVCDPFFDGLKPSNVCVFSESEADEEPPAALVLRWAVFAFVIDDVARPGHGVGVSHSLTNSCVAPGMLLAKSARY